LLFKSRWVQIKADPGQLRKRGGERMTDQGRGEKVQVTIAKRSSGKPKKGESREKENVGKKSWQKNGTTANLKKKAGKRKRCRVGSLK